jgi:hypothetical protein
MVRAIPMVRTWRADLVDKVAKKNADPGMLLG